MRFAYLLSILLLVGIWAGAAWADKDDPNEKPWTYSLPLMLAHFPEQEPNNTCPGQAMACGDVIDPGSLVTNDQDWYRFYATAGTWLTIGTDAYQGSTTDTFLELHFECSPTILTSNDDGGPGLFSLISNFIAPSTGYYDVKCRGYSGSTVGNYILFVTCTVPIPPDPNDTCNPDFSIAHCTNGTLNGNMAYDTNNYSPLSGGCTGYTANGKDVAYKMDLVAGDILDMTYTTTGTDASFYVITDCANAAGTCVVGADAAYNIEHINWTVPATGTYWLILDNYGTNTGGLWNLVYTMDCMGACCTNTDCTVTHQADCAGVWYAGRDCSEPCPVPADKTTWSEIKGSYR